MEEQDPLAELEELLAKLAQQVQETQQTGARVLEAAKAVVKRAKESKTKTRVLTELPRREPSLFYGTIDERVGAFVKIIARLDSPFTVDEAAWITRLERRTTQRRLERAIELDLVTRVSYGKYRVV